MFSRILVTGSLAFDHIMAMPGKFGDFIMPDKIHRLNVSFTVQDFRREDGGTGGNVAYTLALLKKSVTLLSQFGKDAVLYKQKLEACGVDCTFAPIHQDLDSAQGFVMTDRDDNQIWSFYPGAVTAAAELSLKTVLKPGDFVALVPSSPNAFEKHLGEAIEAKQDYLFDPAFLIPTLTAETLRKGLGFASIIVGNDYEIALMEKRSQSRVSDWLSGKTIVITTLGPKGSLIEQGSERWEIPVAKVKDIVDPTGAGDAYRGGFLAGLLEGKPLPECGRMGAVAAAYAVEQMGTQQFQYTPEQFQERYSRSFL